jgi:hypothetical protein
MVKGCIIYTKKLVSLWKCSWSAAADFYNMVSSNSTWQRKNHLGRGSPEMDYKSTVAKEDKQKVFEGALPTTIYQAGHSEVGSV